MKTKSEMEDSDNRNDCPQPPQNQEPQARALRPADESVSESSGSEPSEWQRDAGIRERMRQHFGPEESPELLATESLVHLLWTHNAVFEQLTAHLAPHGFSLAKYNLMFVLRNAPGHHLPMSEAGGRMYVTCANITKLVDSLESDGLAVRVRPAGDRRVVLAELTPKGLELMSRLAPEQHRNIRRLWGDLTDDECRQLTHLLTRLHHNAAKGRAEDDLPAPLGGAEEPAKVGSVWEGASGDEEAIRPVEEGAERKHEKGQEAK